MPKKVSVTTSYTQNELPYLYCSECGRKEYRVAMNGSVCQAYNSSPSKYPGRPCQGAMTLGANTISSLSNHDAHDIKSSS